MSSGDNLVSWSSKSQHAFSRLRAEVEYCGVCNLLVELPCLVAWATIMFYDNARVVYLVSTPMKHQHTKHVELYMHFLTERVSIRNAFVTCSFSSLDCKYIP